MQRNHYIFEGRVGRTNVKFRDEHTEELIQLPLSPFIYFSDDPTVPERVVIERNASGEITSIQKLLAVPGRDTQMDMSEIFPYYAHKEQIPLAKDQPLPVVFKEVTTEEEFEELKYLDQFHYLSAKPSWGRQMYIVAKPATPEVLGTPLPPVLGCVVLTSPQLISGVRNKLLNWNTREDIKQNVDRVVRIARVIVHPEFRGIRLGARLVHHSIEYSRERWNVKGKKAWFVETVAEMSRYHPFFERGGMTYVGETKSQETAFFSDTDSKNLGIQQGKGHVMASLKRFKQKVHSQKPYLMASLLPPNDLLSQAVSAACPTFLVTDSIPLVETRLNEPITLDGITVQYHGNTLWNEPEELNRNWRRAASTSHQDMVTFFESLNRLLEELASEDPSAISALHDGIARMRNYVRVSEDLLQEIQEKLAQLFDQLGGGLRGINDQRLRLLKKVEALRLQIEAELKELNQSRDEDAAVRRTQLNQVRLNVQSVNDRLDIGPVSDKQKWVTGAFGVKPGQPSTILRDLNLEIWPGSIVLVIGPSGSGKSTLLSLLNGSVKPIAGGVAPEGVAENVSTLDLNFDPSRPLIDLVGEDEKEAVFLLNHVDLAESHLYMKRRDQLSHGQRYRAAFARMLGFRRPIWLADEFCAFLDPITTITLSKGIRKLIQQQGITFFAAAAKEDYIREALRPDFVIKINAGGQVTPSPVEMHWSTQPDPFEVHWLLTEGALDDMPSRMELWLRHIGLVHPSPYTLGGLTLTEDALHLQRAAEKGNGAFAEAFAQHLWARDWLFHKLWNRVRFGKRDLHASVKELEPLASRPSQLRYRAEIVSRLLQSSLWVR